MSSGVDLHGFLARPHSGPKAMSPDRLEGKIRNAIRIVEEEVHRNNQKPTEPKDFL